MTALPVVLKAHPMGERQQLGKAFLERLVAGDLAPDVADHAAEPNAQEFERAPSPPALDTLRMLNVQLTLCRSASPTLGD